MEPQTGKKEADDPQSFVAAGFSMRYHAHIQPVELDPYQLIPPLLAQVRRIADLDEPPAGVEGCKDCKLLSGLLEIACGK
jgi:hypothetical protein